MPSDVSIAPPMTKVQSSSRALVRGHTDRHTDRQPEKLILVGLGNLWYLKVNCITANVLHISVILFQAISLLINFLNIGWLSKPKIPKFS